MNYKYFLVAVALCFSAWEPTASVADPKPVVEAQVLAPPAPVEAKPLPPLTEETTPAFDISRRTVKIAGPDVAKLYKNNLYYVVIDGVDAAALDKEIAADNIAFDWTIETDRADRYDIVPTVNPSQLLFTAEPGKYRIWLSIAQKQPFRTRTRYLDISFPDPGKPPAPPFVPPTNDFADLEELIVSRIGALVQLPAEQKKLDCQKIAAVCYDVANNIGKPGYMTTDEIITKAREQINAVLVAGSDRTQAWRQVREATAQYSLEMEKAGRLKTLDQHRNYFLAVQRAYLKAGG
jgi:hypothetical protein